MSLESFWSYEACSLVDSLRAMISVSLELLQVDTIYKTLYLKVIYVICKVMSYTCFLEYSKDVALFSFDTKHCCQKSDDHLIFFRF